MSLAVEKVGRVRVLRMERPAARNALDAKMREQLIEALQDAELDNEVGAVVLTGHERVFAAGADLKELLTRTSEQQRAFLQPPHIYSVIETLRKPVLAAINGHALGAGLELATACDLRVAHPKAKLGQPEIRFALLPGGGGTQRLPRLIGPGQASRLVLTGDIIDGTEAVSLGLVDVLDDDPLQAAIDLAARIGAHDPEAVAVAKHSLRCARQMPYDAGLDHEVEAFVTLHARQESRDRIHDFLGS